MLDLLRELRADTHHIILEDGPNHIGRWRVGSDLGHLFGDVPTTQRSLGTNSERFFSRFKPRVHRYYHSPEQSIGAGYDGEATVVDIDPQATEVITVMQAYADYIRELRPHQLQLKFLIPPNELNGAVRGDNWVFSAQLESEDVARGTIRAVSAMYPDRLCLAAEGLTRIAGKHLPDKGTTIIEQYYAPEGLEALKATWEEAMDEDSALRAAQLILKRCTNLRAF